MISAYPLCWPEGFPRTKARESGKFRTTLSGALRNVQDSLRLFGTDSGRSITEVVLSSNVALGADKPSDPAVAAWFLWDGEQRCIPVDRYSTPAANLQAIHHVLEARRVELRHGTLALVRASFRGFTAALPAPGAKRWFEVLGVSPDASEEMIHEAFRRLAKSRHPDRGGSDVLMAELNNARSAGLRERGESA